MAEAGGAVDEFALLGGAGVAEIGREGEEAHHRMRGEEREHHVAAFYMPAQHHLRRGLAMRRGGVQFVAIPEFAGLATSVGEIFSAALAGQKTVDEALAEAQALSVSEMTAAGYIK